jgi:regulator of replication initiation timing
LDGIEQTQNTVVLSVEQMTALDNHLSALAEEKQTLTSEMTSLREQVNDLTTQVENLQKADGDETSHIEDGVENEEHYAIRARNDYERLKHLC